MIIKKMLAKEKKLYAAFLDLEKAYNRVDWEAMWDVLKVYGGERGLVEWKHSTERPVHVSELEEKWVNVSKYRGV